MKLKYDTYEKIEFVYESKGRLYRGQGTVLKYKKGFLFRQNRYLINAILIIKGQIYDFEEECCIWVQESNIIRSLEEKDR